MNCINKEKIIKLFKGSADGVFDPKRKAYIINVQDFESDSIEIEGEDFTENKKILFDGNNSSFKVNFKNTKFSKLIINGLSNLSFDNCEFDQIQIKTSAETNFIFKEGKIRELRGSWGKASYNNVNIDNLFYSSNNQPIDLTGFKEIKTFNIQSSPIGHLKLGKNVKNLKFFRFYYDEGGTIESFTSSKQSEIIVEESDLSKITFYNCDLSMAVLKYKNSTLVNLKYINSRLPNKSIEIDSEKSSIEAYRQLKIVSKKHYDRFNELKFKAKEQDAHFKRLKFPEDFNSLIVLGFNKYSNCYGTKWWPSLLLILGLGFGFYYLYLSTICSNVFGYEEFFQGYFQFISPFHKIELLGSDYKYSGLSYFIDIFHRIINYFLIYQGAQAFRMYGKS